ncbi:iron-sulfur cluster assembly scaffold protein [Erythrobacter sp. GH1-10]|uniref:iron-sulfur cluster assembly scaffold protein n=1 Tax=Erythrobacter sp. GH1-10 TaxID=3349334 RepID=UPI003877E763
MAERATEKLYSPRLLALSASLADFPLDHPFELRAEARSRTCGSTIEVGLETDAGGAVTRIGMQVSACAVGQSSAAVLASDIRGRTARDVSTALERIERWLERGGDPPDWPGFDALLPAQAHSGRHGALLLPWKAVVEALCSGTANR